MEDQGVMMTIVSPRSVLKEAYSMGIINGPELWNEAVDSRNLMSHIYDESTAPASLKYGAFITGDNAYSVINNPDVTDSSSCIVVKESFGNAFVPFLTDHYQTIHVIDYRYWKGSISQFAQDKGVQDVLFVNNLSAIRSTALVGYLHNVV